MENVRVRMAPSPTGNLHLGTAYTALFNYLFAKKNNGTFVLRIEDTDTERSKKEFEDNIIAGLKWLGLSWDEGPFRQSERLKNYDEAIDKLIAEKKAYYCFCTPEELEKEREEQKKNGVSQIYSGKCRNLSEDEIKQNLESGKDKIVRFKMPEERGQIEFEDLLHGRVAFNSNLIGDMVIKRTNGMPLYNFTVVVDDIDMKISHVLRGDDHISNTPKQIVLFEALGATVPVFAHWPMILNPDRIGKLSKRDNATSVDDYRKDGYLAEAMINYFALLGWTMPEEREIMDLAEMEKSFDIKKMRLSGAAYNQDKFDWINGEYIRKLSDEELRERIKVYLSDISEGDLGESDRPNEDDLKKVLPLIQERIKKLSDFVPMTDFLWEKPEYEISVFERVLGSKQGNLKAFMTRILEEMEKLEKPWKKEDFEAKFQELAKALGLSNTELFQLIRVAVSGQTVTPPLFESLEILGEDEVINRIKGVLEGVLS